jgi:hypothetical protein
MSANAYAYQETAEERARVDAALARMGVSRSPKPRAEVVDLNDPSTSPSRTTTIRQTVSRAFISEMTRTAHARKTPCAATGFLTISIFSAR